MSNIRLSKGIGFGLIGGLAGTLVMDLVMVGEFLMVGLSSDYYFGWWGMVANTLFTLIGISFGGGVPMGVTLHYLTGLLTGLVFGAVVSWVDRIDTTGKIVGLGVLVGMATVPLACLPLAVILGEPVATLLGFSFFPHLLFGVVLGGVTSYGL